GFLDGVNDNPNSPTSVIPRVLLPGAEGNLAYVQGGDISRFTSIMTQYITGASRQFVSYNDYAFSEEDFNNAWNNVYAATMSNFHSIISINAAEGTAGHYDAYDGVSRILMAYSIGMTTDVWGDIPYTEAFQGNENLTPAYDNQENIYASIQQLLDEGIGILGNSDLLDDDVEAPGSDDFIYNGDLDAWTSFAHALKARYYIHLTKVDPNAAANALAEINAGGAISDALYPFTSAGPGPAFQYIEQRDDIVYDGACLQQMQAKNDPRYPVYIDVNGDYWGPGYLGPFFSADNSPVILMTEFERKFIEAEALARTGGDAQTAFTEAIQSSMDFYGVAAEDAATYIAANGTLSGDMNSMIAQIIYEKWVANYLHPESWVDLRRTGTPVLTPNAGGTIPTRFIYPTNERLYNNSIPDQNSTMFSPELWWNQ
ncbi:MAG: SusD/RagB family nutrient-binding outer membrane lipoprotein, partial [Chitinophagales bacterium]